MYGEDLSILTGMQKNIYGDGIKGHDSPVIHQKTQLQAVARLAVLLVERWGLVACVFDGEDSSGRQKMRVMTSQELVTAACDAAQETWKQIEERGWTLDVPAPTPNLAKKRELEEEA